MDENRKPGWAFWTASTLFSLVLYVASLGPAAWLFVKVGRPETSARVLDIIYAPVFLLNDIPDETRLGLIRDMFGEHFEVYLEWWASRAEP